MEVSAHKSCAVAAAAGGRTLVEENYAAAVVDRSLVEENHVAEADHTGGRMDLHERSGVGDSLVGHDTGAVVVVDGRRRRGSVLPGDAVSGAAGRLRISG